MPEKKFDDERIYAHLLTLLSVSAAMVGVCLTAIGLVSGIRTRIRRTWPTFMLVLDVVFCIGIASMVVTSMLLTFLVI